MASHPSLIIKHHSQIIALPGPHCFLLFCLSVVFSLQYYVLEEDEWRFDTIPEFMDGKNTMDFFDADIEERLRALEEEEAQLEANGAYAPEEDDGEDLDEEEMVLYEAIKEKQEIARKKNHETKSVIPKMFALRGRTEGNNTLQYSFNHHAVCYCILYFDYHFHQHPLYPQHLSTFSSNQSPSFTLDTSKRMCGMLWKA